MNKNIWKDFAQLNDMQPEEFFDEITMAAIAVMSLRLDDAESNGMKVTQGKYTLMLIDNKKVSK